MNKPDLDVKRTKWGMAVIDYLTFFAYTLVVGVNVNVNLKTRSINVESMWLYNLYIILLCIPL